MSVAWIRTDKGTGDILGVYTGSIEARATYKETATVAVHHVRSDHPVIHDHGKWKGSGKKLVKKRVRR